LVALVGQFAAIMADGWWLMAGCWLAAAAAAAAAGWRWLLLLLLLLLLPAG
jgi:hypothetical protein